MLSETSLSFVYMKCTANRRSRNRLPRMTFSRLVTEKTPSRPADDVVVHDSRAGRVPERDGRPPLRPAQRAEPLDKVAADNAPAVAHRHRRDQVVLKRVVFDDRAISRSVEEDAGLLVDQTEAGAAHRQIADRDVGRGHPERASFAGGRRPRPPARLRASGPACRSRRCRDARRRRAGACRRARRGRSPRPARRPPEPRSWPRVRRPPAEQEAAQPQSQPAAVRLSSPLPHQKGALGAALRSSCLRPSSDARSSARTSPCAGHGRTTDNTTNAPRPIGDESDGGGLLRRDLHHDPVADDREAVC